MWVEKTVTLKYSQQSYSFFFVNIYGFKDISGYIQHAIILCIASFGINHQPLCGQGG